MSEPASLMTIPADVLEMVGGRRAASVHFAAGPAFVGQYNHTFEAPVPLAAALEHLARYQSSLRIGRIVLVDGVTLFFDHEGYLSHGR